jgi:tetratricopeptide (TPR) repeat protein
MKKLIFVFLLLVMASISSLGQTAEDYLNNGNAQFNQQNYAGAVESYTKAIALDPNFALAYYNRGTSYEK